MASRQFSTFSVAEILGQGAEETTTQRLTDSFPRTTTTTTINSNGESETSSRSSSGPVKYRPGRITQMLPPVPRYSTSGDEQPFHDYLEPTVETSPPRDTGAEQEEDKNRPAANAKRGTRGKKGAKRSRDSGDESPLSIVGEEDDVFPPCLARSSKPSRRSRRRRTSAATAHAPSGTAALLALPGARDLTSSGGTPSPPGTKSGGTTTTNTSSNTKSSSDTVKTTNSTTVSDQNYDELEDEEEEERPKKKRVRTAYTREQLHTMERHFRKSAYPDNHLLRVISSEASIPISKIQVWFQNRRAKARKWGQMLPEPSNNSALYRGVLPNTESSRYLPPLQPTSGATPPRETPPTTSLNLPSTSTQLLPSLITSYQRFYPPPPYPLPSTYPLLPPACPLPYPLSYSLYTGLPTSTPTLHTTSHQQPEQQGTGSQAAITVNNSGDRDS